MRGFKVCAGLTTLTDRFIELTDRLVSAVELQTLSRR